MRASHCLSYCGVFVSILAFTFILLAIPSASAQQNELAALNQQVIKLYQAGRKAEAMLAYLSDKSEDRNAYPAYWGPFSLIGEGSAR
jgi:hypothetical protein